MQAAQNLRALFLGRTAETCECGIGCSNSAPRIFFIAQCAAADYLTVSWLDDVHDFSAVGFNECPIDVVCCDCFHCFSPGARFSVNRSAPRSTNVTYFHAALCRSTLSARNRCTRWTAIA